MRPGAPTLCAFLLVLCAPACRRPGKPPPLSRDPPAESGDDAGADPAAFVPAPCGGTLTEAKPWVHGSAFMLLEVPTVTGGLSPRVIQEVVTRNEAFNPCYDLFANGAKSDRDLAVVINLAIDRAGRVANASSMSSGIDHPGVVECVRDALRPMQFPVPYGGEVDATLSLEFSLKRANRRPHHGVYGECAGKDDGDLCLAYPTTNPTDGVCQTDHEEGDPTRPRSIGGDFASHCDCDANAAADDFAEADARARGASPRPRGRDAGPDKRRYAMGERLPTSPSRDICHQGIVALDAPRFMRDLVIRQASEYERVELVQGVCQGREILLVGSHLEYPVDIGDFTLALDADSLELRWWTGPCPRHTYTLAVAGRQVVLFDQRSLAHVLSIDDGTETMVLALGERTRGATGAPDGGEVWAPFSTRSGNTAVLLDLEAGTVRPTAERPSFVPPSPPVVFPRARVSPVARVGDVSITLEGRQSVAKRGSAVLWKHDRVTHVWAWGSRMYEVGLRQAGQLAGVYRGALTRIDATTGRVLAEFPGVDPAPAR